MATTLNDLRHMSLTQLKAVTKEDIHAVLQRDKGEDTERLQQGINEINRKLNEEVIRKLEDIPRMRKELDDLKTLVNTQASIIEQQQRFLEQVDSKDRSQNLVITGVSEVT